MASSMYVGWSRSGSESTSPRSIAAALDALEVHRGPLAGDGRRHGLAVGLDAAHLGLERSRVDLDALVQRELPGRDGARSPPCRTPGS